MDTDQIALILSCVAITFTAVRWLVDTRLSKAQQRLEFIRELFTGFSSHNWSFIKYWDFPGVHPGIKELIAVVSPDKVEEEKAVFGSRVVALEHLNILMKIFTHRSILTSEDILGFASWGQSWYDDSVESLRVILTRGDTLPLDYIIWLRDVVFHDKPFQTLIGDELNARLREYEAAKRTLFQRR